MPVALCHWSGYLQSSLFTFSIAIVDAATRLAERVDTAQQIFLNRSASKAVNVLPLGSGKCLLSNVIV